MRGGPNSNNFERELPDLGQIPRQDESLIHQSPAEIDLIPQHSLVMEVDSRMTLEAGKAREIVEADELEPIVEAHSRTSKTRKGFLHVKTLMIQKYSEIFEISMLLYAMNAAHSLQRRGRKLDQATIVLYTSFMGLYEHILSINLLIHGFVLYCLLH